MKIAVKDLEPNPFRDFASYVTDNERIEGIKDSIRMDEFWGGIPVRPHPTKKGKYQIGCGHHRLVCLKENGIKEVEITAIYPYSDAQMLRIMINENAQYAARPILVNSDIEKVKNKLQEWVDQYKTWEQACADNDFSTKFPLIKNAKSFVKLKEQHIGRPTILAYLGKPWAKRGWMIQAALATLKAEKEGSVDREAIDTIPTIDQANIFRATVQKHKIPKPAQKKLAKQIVAEKIGSKQIPDLVAEHALPLPSKEKHKELKPLPMLDDYVKDTIKAIHEACLRLKRIDKNLENIQSPPLKETFYSEAKELHNILNKIIQCKETKNENKKKVQKVAVLG